MNVKMMHNGHLMIDVSGTR